MHIIEANTGSRKGVNAMTWSKHLTCAAAGAASLMAVQTAAGGNAGSITTSANGSIAGGNTTTAATSTLAGGSIDTSNQQTVSGSISGSAIFSQPFQGGNYGKVVIYLNNLNGTATYTFPASFQHAPATLGPQAAAATTISTTSVTVTGSGTTGFLFLEGF